VIGAAGQIQALAKLIGVPTRDIPSMPPKGLVFGNEFEQPINQDAVVILEERLVLQIDPAISNLSAIAQLHDGNGRRTAGPNKTLNNLMGSTVNAKQTALA
jgi:hypothetical protein